MGKVQRLSHKEIEAVIRRNELEDYSVIAVDWVKSHLENVLIGVVAAALLGFGTFYFFKSRHDDSNKASLQLSSAAMQMSRGLESNDKQSYEAAEAGLQQIRTAYGSTPEADTAALELAGLSFAQGKFDEASAAYHQFADTHASSPLLPLAQSGIAACLEAQGKLKDAETAYLALAQSQTLSEVSAISYFDAARCMQDDGDKGQLKSVADALTKMDAAGQLPKTLEIRLQGLKQNL